MSVTLLLDCLMLLIRIWDNKDYPNITELEHATKFPDDTRVGLVIYVLKVIDSRKNEME